MDENLVISCPFLRLTMSRWILSRRHTKWHLLETNAKLLWFTVVQSNDRLHHTGEQQVLPQDDLAVCLGRPFYAFLQERTCKGALVAIGESRKIRCKRTTICRFLCSVSLARISQPSFEDRSVECVGNGSIVEGELLKGSRLWCVG